MTPTEAKAKLEEAIEAFKVAYCEANPEARQSGTLVDWIVVAAEVVPGDTPQDDETVYAVIFPDGTPNYRAVGLLRMGMHYSMPWEED